MAKSTTTFTGIHFALIYTDKLAPTQAFYEKYFGFEKTDDFSDTEIYGTAGEIEMWIGSEYKPTKMTEKSTRGTSMFGVESALDLFKAFKKDGVKTVHKKPVEMQPGAFWFQFYDPAGNIIDVLGPE